jgi:hypothetical protein
VRPVLLSALLALGVSGGSVPAAYAQGGRSGTSTVQTAENMNALRELRAFGICYARFHRNDALVLLATTPNTREEADVYGRLVGGERGDCLGAGTWTSGSMSYLRGVIFEGLLEANQPIPPNLMLSAPSVEQVRDLHGVARCYVSGHRDEARSVLATRIGSREETAAIAAIWNEVRACFPQTLNVRLNAPWIRFLLAEALLRTGTTPRPQAGN